MLYREPYWGTGFCLELLFPPLVFPMHMCSLLSVHLGWGGICLLSASNQGDDEVIRNPLQVKRGGGKRERGVHSTQVVYCKLFAELNLAVEQEHWQWSRGTFKCTTSVYFGGAEPISAFIREPGVYLHSLSWSCIPDLQLRWKEGKSLCAKWVGGGKILCFPTTVFNEKSSRQQLLFC